MRLILNRWGGSGYTWVGDFDGDGQSDIASAKGRNIYMNLSEENTFNSVTWTVPNRWGGSGYTWVGDFNGDGRSDIASASGGNIYMNLSTGSRFNSRTWTVPNRWGAAGYTWVGDFNGDGKSDVASARGGNIYVHLSTGSGFDSDTWSVPNRWGTAGYTWVGDFNGDGKSDIASARGGSVFLHLSTGRSFNSSTRGVPGHWGGAGFTFIGHFDQSGYPDIATASGGAVYVHSLFDSARTADTWTATDNWNGADYTWVGDFNGDGKSDIASASGRNVYLKLSTGGGFNSTTWTVPGSWGGSGYTWVGDFNGDGKSDLASVSGGNVHMNLSNGRSFSSSTWTVPNNWGGAGYTWVGDFNGDGVTDIASAAGGSVHHHHSNGRGFDSFTWMAPNRWGGAEYSWAADFNGDGRADIASASGRDIFVQISHERLREEPIVEAMLQALRQIDANVLSNDTLAEEVFGSFNVSRLNALREMIESNSQELHDWFPEVVFFDPSRSSISDYDGSASFFDVASARFVEAPTLSGTYKDETVFLSEDFLGLNDQLLPTARCVFVQELAHHIDHYFGHESLGAEGLLVALEVCGGGADLDATELAALRERDDRADIELQTGSGYLSISGAELGLWKNIGIGVGITAAIVVIAIAPEALPFLAEAAEAVEATGASVEAAEAAEAALEAQTDVVALVGEGEEGVELAETAAEAADMALFEDPFAEGALEHVTEGEIGVQPQDLGRLRGGLHFERGLTSFISNYENVVGEVVEYVAQPCTNADFEAQVAEIFYDSTEYAESGNTINGLEWPNGVRIRQFGNELITGREARNATLRVGGQAFKGVKSFFPESWTEDMITQLGRMIARAADGGWADGDNTMGRYNPSSSGSWSYLQPSVNPHVWGFACGLVGAKICIIAGAANALGTQKSRRGTYWAETTRLTPIVLNFLGLRGIAASAYRGTRLSGRRRHWRRDSSVRCL